MESFISVLLFIGFLYLMMRFGCGAHMSSGGGGCGHAHHHEKTGEKPTGQTTSDAKQLTRDPVCGMEIETGKAARSREYGTDTFYFCSNDCYWKFKERPEYYAEIVRMEKRYVA